MELYLYNTLSRSKEKFIGIKQGEAGIYTCGPTVYLYAHIGNLRTYVFEDVLKRALTYSGYKVQHVMNVTDVGHLVSDSDEGEDKMEIGSRREGKTAWEIAGFYTEAFFRDFKDLNCIMPDVLCKATYHIKEMIKLISALEKNGMTYGISDGIYFDVSKFPDYGKLAGKSHVEGIKAGARVEHNPEKRNPADFALWKFTPAGQQRQMEWDSKWGRGFPGWHIECSAMSLKYLGETFDIHCGGVDHIAIHHTNEIAQSEAATGRKFVNYWLHGEFLVMTGADKMAKSAGNFITLSALNDRGYGALDYRYFCFSAHYRKQLEFSWEALASSKQSLSTLRENIWSLQDDALKHGVRRNKAALPAIGAASAASGQNMDKKSAHHEKFRQAVADDLNVPQALAVLWEVLRDKTICPAEKLEFVKDSDRIFGLNLMSPRPLEELPAETASLIDERDRARKNKDFKKADEIRKELLEKGVAVEDTPRGVRWKIIKN
ncbi:MAG: cysteine--tRNA ligase [Elusimicrobia bacterium]|nr:cysteine--tRNA ligase [Elusimicrobiota bacterium]